MADDNQALAGYTDWKQWRDDTFGQCSRGEARYFAWHLARRHPAPLRSVLEIGYGNGNFLGFARARGIEVVGVETQPALRTRAMAAGIENHASVDDLPPGRRYDLSATQSASCAAPCRPCWNAWWPSPTTRGCARCHPTWW